MACAVFVLHNNILVREEVITAVDCFICTVMYVPPLSIRHNFMAHNHLTNFAFCLIGLICVNKLFLKLISHGHFLFTKVGVYFNIILKSCRRCVLLVYNMLLQSLQATVVSSDGVLKDL